MLNQLLTDSSGSSSSSISSSSSLLTTRVQTNISFNMQSHMKWQSMT